MNRRILYCSLVVLCFIANVVQGQINHQVTFSSDMQKTEETLDDGKTYTRVTMPGLQQTDSVGYPALPVKYVKLLIPANAMVKNVVINTAKKQKIQLRHNIEPVQKSIPISQSNQKHEFIKPDQWRYGSNLPYPLNLVEIVADDYFREDHIVTLAVYPCRYYPKNNELEQYESLNITLNYTENTKTLKKQVKAKENRKHKIILESIIDNKTDIEKFAVQNSGEDLGTTPITLKSSTSTVKASEGGIFVSCDYVVITNESLAPAFNEFIAWKRRKGVSIELITIEDIIANYTGDEISGISDDAGKLRQFLADAYDSGNGIEYALLGGDNTIVPIRHGYDNNTTTDDAYIIPTDLYFSEFQGDWEVDNDGRYGEPYVSTSVGDDVDFSPEIYIGRIMVTSVEEVKNWTSKILQYELNPGNGSYSYLRRAFYTQADHLQSYYETPGGQARYIAKKFYSVFNDTLVWSEMYNGVPNYNSPEIPYSPKGRDIISRINSNNYGFVSWFAHGTTIGVAVGTKGNNGTGEEHCKWNVSTIDNYDALYGYQHAEETDNGLDDLTNKYFPAINYSISCETMPFDDFTTPTGSRNMGESFTCMNIGGGPAYLGNTRYGFVANSYKVFEQFIKVITDNTSYHLGVAEATSKQNYNHRFLRFSHNLIGCPETELWTDIPSKFTNASVIESGNNIIVSTGGVSGSTICVMSALDDGSSYYQVRLNVLSDTFTSVPKPYLVTITKHNYIPYLKDPDNIYIQNESIYSARYIYGKYFYAGENVTTSKPQGPAIIKNGSNVVFDAANDVYLEGGFEVEKGSFFEIK